MRFARGSTGLVLAIVAVLTLSSIGCSEREKKADPQAKAKAKEDDKKDGGKHDDWWCQEHGVPEHLCSLCTPAVASKYKKEGKWCKIHDRAEEQCFKCDPARYKKYEAMYIAKYNKKPEPPPEDEFKK